MTKQSAAACREIGFGLWATRANDQQLVAQTGVVGTRCIGGGNLYGTDGSPNNRVLPCGADRPGGEN